MAVGLAQSVEYLTAREVAGWIPRTGLNLSVLKQTERWRHRIGGGGGGGGGISKRVIITVVITHRKGSIANIKEPISSPTKTATGIAVYTIRNELLITSVILYNLGSGQSRT